VVCARGVAARVRTLRAMVRGMHGLWIMKILTYVLTLSILGSLSGCVVRERGVRHHHHHPRTVIIRG
jgi:hypothetical protein